MPHGRKQIRDAVETDLIAAFPSATVKASRAYNVNSETTQIFIYTPRDRIVDRHSGGLIRNLSLIIEVFVSSGAETVDDDLDAAATLVEQTISENEFSDLAKDTVLEETETEFDGTGATPKGMARLTYQVVYETDRTDPETVT